MTEKKAKPKSESQVKPSKEKLEKLIKEKGYRYAGEQYGVSDNTARRWAMAYGIDLEPKCELKARSRQGYQFIDGRFVYDKHIKKSGEKVKAPTPRKQKESTEIPAQAEVQAPAPTKAPELKVRKQEPIDLSKIKNRYSPAELAEFKRLVEEKIQLGFEDICQLKDNLSRVRENGTDDTATSGNAFEEGTASIERENMTALVAKKQKHLSALSNALLRIGNGTYGICVVTGKLIPKERLLAVPHATKCVEAKTDSDNGKVVTPVADTVTGNDDDEK